MYRTDKKFMRNPTTASSRIYIGYLQESVLPGDLEHKFKAYGNILGLVLQRGFAFIQYENEAQAQAAIAQENGQMFFGRNIVVRRAMEKRRNSPPPSTAPPVNAPIQNTKVEEPEVVKQQQQQQPPVQHSPVNLPPQKSQNQNPPSHDPPLHNPPSHNPPPHNPPLHKPPSHNPPLHNPPSRTPEPKQDNALPEKRRKPYRPHPERLPPPPAIDNYRNPSSYYPSREEDYPPPVPYNPIPVDRPERNDCEIIVVSKPLTEYAEYIEQRLKSLNLIVDLLFPNDDVPIGRVLANISSRGCLYAILVMPQNEEHRSLTLNILHGIPQEHRNIPVEDALILISRNFEAYMRGEQTGPNILGSDVSSISDRHPESMQMLINLLAENRQLTTVQYDKLIKYLQERRDLQNQYEISEGIETVSNESSSKQTELQNRIMNILNKSASTAKPAVVAPTTGVSTTQTPLLNDPSVQKALDSLLSGDMFKSISASL